MLSDIRRDLEKLADPEKAKILSRFFKTGRGEYGEGDIFLGVKVPQQRKIARKYASLPLEDIRALMGSKIHEQRLTSLLILVAKFKKADARGKKEIVDLYLKNTGNINNWDLVDSSAPYILGQYLLGKDRSVLYRLAKSGSIWERRIAMMSTFAFIKNNEFEYALKISAMLIGDEHDLIHKAAGWMLREIGNRDIKAEEQFLKEYCKKMPRTMLRYAVEKFDEGKRRKYMEK